MEKQITRTILFTGTTPEELEERIYNRLGSKIDSLKSEFQPKEPAVFLTRNEVRDMLKCDLSTVHNLTKRGKLKAYGIGGRVYYKRSEVEEAIKPLN